MNEKKIEAFWNNTQKKLEVYIENKFKSGRKSFRTGFVKKAFGKYYPKEAYFYSKCLDEYTSAMDDLYDDTKMAEKEVRINVLLAHKVVMDVVLWPKTLREIAFDHFEKMVKIAAFQEFTNSELSKTKHENKAIEIAMKNYEVRAIDIDFAIKIPAYFSKSRKKEIKLLLDAGRVFRGINLFFKDIKDIRHDIFHKTKTPVVIFHKKGFDIQLLKEKMYENSMKKIQTLKRETNNETVLKIIKNFEKMIKNEGSQKL